jgi:hypothetical protein
LFSYIIQEDIDILFLFITHKSIINKKIKKRRQFMKGKKTKKLSEIDRLTIADILHASQCNQNSKLRLNANLCLFTLLKLSKGDFQKHIFKDELIKEYNQIVEDCNRITDDNEALWDEIFKNLQSKNLIMTATNAIRITSVTAEKMKKIFGEIDFNK